ncbi:MAG: Hsp20/alpha crystallin family protein [Phycisphaerae bacterium]|jgi:HSP20 family protein
MSEEKESKTGNDFSSAERINFNTLFKGIENLIDLASKLSPGEEITKNGEFVGLPDGAKGVYGFSMRTLAGKPIIERFGNIKETVRGPVVGEVREPIIDVFDEDSHVLVIAELPGVSEDEIEIKVDGDILHLTTSGSELVYAKEILLPIKIKANSMNTSYKNGIVKITFDKE